MELLNFEMEVTNILQMKMYKLPKEERVPIIKNWLGREDLQLKKTFINAEKETCKTGRGLIFTLSEKFKLCHNLIVLSLQYCKLKERVMSCT